jgi:hypothetical protein
MKEIGTRVKHFGIVLAALAVAGCSKTGTISGKVTLNGEPLPGGMVFASSGNPDRDFERAPAARIEPDGSYFMIDVPRGKVRLCVMTVAKMGSVRSPDAVKEPWGAFVPIPARYGDAAKSGFSLELNSRRQEYSLALVGDAPDSSSLAPASP